jgi:pyruvate decarboxylase
LYTIKVYRTPSGVIERIGGGSSPLTAREISTIVRYGLRPTIVLITNRGYTIEAEIHDSLYNRIKNWDHTGLLVLYNA